MKILNLDNWCKEATDIIEQWLIKPKSSTKKLNGINCDGIILDISKDVPFLPHYKHLKFIASCTTGLDHIDTEYCKAKGIEIISLQGETEFLQDVWATAEHCWALIMALIRKVPWAFDDVKQGNWDREAWQGVELRGKKLLIVGYGRVGRQVAKFAETFGMTIQWYDAGICKPTKEYQQWFRDALGWADIITVHVPLNEQTKGMFGAEQFRMMKPTAYFINTSRGAVVDEDALISALSDELIKGAALDVVEHEPSPYKWLIRYAETNNNLVVTPHIAGNTTESRRKTQLYLADRIKQFVERQGG